MTDRPRVKELDRPRVKELDRVTLVAYEQPTLAILKKYVPKVTVVERRVFCATSTRFEVAHLTVSQKRLGVFLCSLPSHEHYCVVPPGDDVQPYIDEARGRIKASMDTLRSNLAEVQQAVDALEETLQDEIPVKRL